MSENIYEAMRASRPLEDVAWLDDVESAAVAGLGEGVLDFHDKDLGERELVLMGTGEQASMQIFAGHLEGVSSYELIRAAKARMPGSFSMAAHPGLTGDVALVPMKEDSGDKHILTAGIEGSRQLALERSSILEAIEEAVQKRLPWRTTRLRIKLASVLISDYVDKQALAEVAARLPRAIRLGEGQIDPVKFQLREAPAERV
jgi:hypothetical protein